MMFIALKPIALGGQYYSVGDTIEEAAVAPGRVAALVDSHVIAEATVNLGEGYVIAEAAIQQRSDSGSGFIPFECEKTGERLMLAESDVLKAFEILKSPTLKARELLTEAGETTLKVLLEVDRRRAIQNAIRGDDEE